MKKTFLLLLCVLLLLPLVGCEKNDEPEWKKKVDSIEAGMSYEELVALMGEPDADIGSGSTIFVYILPEKQVIAVGMVKDFTQQPTRLIVRATPVVQTYDQFKECYQYYPDDPNAWWNYDD